MTMKTIRTTLQILFALSLLTLSLCDCNGPTEPEYDGPWEKVEVPALIGYYAIYFLDANDGWVAGSRNIGHWDGQKWSIVKEYNFGDYYYSFWGISSVNDEVWFGGHKHRDGNNENAVVVRYANGEWTSEEIHDLQSCGDIWMFDDGTGWICGSYGTVYYDGTDWIKINSIAVYNLYFNSKTDGWACGMSSIYHWDGSEWTKVFTDYSVWFQDVYFAAPDDGWAVGYASAYGVAEHFHYDGTEWTRITDPVIEHVPLDAVHFVDSNWGWFIGTGSTYLYKNGEWYEYPYAIDASSYHVEDIYCINKNNVWISAWPDFMHFSGFDK